MFFSRSWLLDQPSAVTFLLSDCLAWNAPDTAHLNAFLRQVLAAVEAGLAIPAVELMPITLANPSGLNSFFNNTGGEALGHLQCLIVQA